MPFSQYLTYLFFRIFFSSSRNFHEWHMLALVNKERRKHRLRPLRMERDLRILARKHSADMARQGYFSHTNPKNLSPAERIQRHGISDSTTGENLAFVQGYKLPTETAMKGLMDSPGHRENILRPLYTGVGIGLVISQKNGWYYTQNFVRRSLAYFGVPRVCVLGKKIRVRMQFRKTPDTSHLLRVLRYEQEVHSHVFTKPIRTASYIYIPKEAGTYVFQLFELSGRDGRLLNQQTCRVTRSWWGMFLK